MRTKLFLTLTSALLLAACAGQPPADSGTAPAAGLNSTQAFQLCESEGAVALVMARSYLVLNKRNKAAALNGAGPNDKAARRIAQELFDGADQGRIHHHADFAADKLMACASEFKLAVNRPREHVRGCYARVDIPFFLQGFKASGMTQAAAVNKTRAVLKDAKLYPRERVELAAREIYAADASMSEDRYQKAWFWQCMYGR